VSELLFPLSAPISKSRWDVVSNTAASRSIFTGAVRTTSRTGDRYRIGINVSNANNKGTYPAKSALRAIRAALGGQANRIWVWDPDYVQRGSFQAAELFANNMFTNGVNNWQNSLSLAISSHDRVLRMALSGSPSAPSLSQLAPTQQYVPYCMRVFLKEGRGGGLTAGYWESILQGNTFFATKVLSDGMNFSKLTMDDANSQTHYPLFPVSGSFPTGALIGDYLDLHYVSVARCAIVDNGQNLALFSDQFDNAAWGKTNCTVTANGTAAPDRNSAADIVVENTTNGAHGVSQTFTVPISTSDDLCFSVMIKANVRTWAYLEMFNGSDTAFLWVNLSTGALGATSTSGSTFSLPRGFVADMGNGWYWVTLLAMKQTSATSISAFVGATTGNSVASYAGVSSQNAISLWRGGFALSSNPVKHVQTTSATIANATQSGSGLNLRGLAVFNAGQLLPGDRVQIGTQLNTVTASLNASAVGTGHLQCAIPWRTPPADGDAVIINNPMARCVLTENVGGWSNSPGGFGDFDFEFEEALDS
jgi:hypothetical protein